MVLEKELAMMTKTMMMIDLIWFPALLVVLLVIAVPILLIYSQRNKKHSSYPFNEFGKVDIPYVTIDVQGHPLNLIVDTGCGISIIHTPVLMDKSILYKVSEKKVDISALTMEKKTLDSVFIDFVINNRIITQEFFTHSDDDFGNFRQMYGIEIHGLLGSDFLDAYRCKIDFKKHSLIVK